MLYVFIVSSGSMLKFDMNLAVKKVTELKSEIERSFEIPVEEQVLLCSGGEELQEENMVGNYYGAGTDTNPIFLFRKFTADCEYSYNVPLHTSIDLSIEDDVHGCANMAPSSSTVTVRAALAQRFADAAVKGRRECDELVHAQHLQQQGWAAVIANLEDGKDTLMKRKTHCEEHFLKYLAKRSHYQEVIKMFPEDIDVLAKIPLSSKLMFGSEYFNQELDADQTTLLAWVCTEPRSFLDALVEKCQRSLEELNEHCLSALSEDVCSVLKNADNPDIKEVKGIEERLSLLNKQIEEAKRLEKDQRDLATWFGHTQSRLSRDPAVIPDLCATFQKQLLLMLANHKCLRDILERCTRAKMELSESITYRIKYISRVESDMYGLQLRIKFLEKYVQSVSMQIESFEQVHSAPKRYVQLLAETCRRRLFSSTYMKWASELSAQTLKLYEKEMSIRRSFEDEDSRNIVDNLFPGMEDVPPPFATECPRPFDQNLPDIVREDLDILKIQFPEFAHFCEVLPPDSMPHVSSQAETDSAFSSNVPSSSKNPHKLAAPSGDYGSLPSEDASLPNEVFSLASSPFEDPLSPHHHHHPLDSASSKQRTTTRATDAGRTSSPIQETESDGCEEFETVDGPSLEIRPPQASSSCDRKRSASAPRPNSTSEVMNIAKRDAPRLSKARSDGDTISPIQERLKSSESLLVSADGFQSTEYYIDDSMPSSYTESNATSPLPRQHRMVKSHHVVVAELQKQVDDRNNRFIDIVKCIQLMQERLREDVHGLRSHVRDQFVEYVDVQMKEFEVSIKGVLEAFQTQALEEKEKALLEANRKASATEADFVKRLEVECQKLSDAESQISNYEEYIQQILANLEEAKVERDTLESKLNSKEEIIKSMMLEHELELDSVRNQMKQELQTRDDEILEALKNLNDKEFEFQNLEQQKDLSEEDLRKQTQEVERISSVLQQKETQLMEKSKQLKELQEQIQQFQEAEEEVEKKMGFLQFELEKEKASRVEFSDKLKEAESSKARELSDLEEKLTLQHKSEMESLRSRYKLAVSTTASALEKSAAGTLEEEETESEVIQSLLAEQESKVREAVAAALNQEMVKHHKEKMQIISNMRREREESVEKSKARLVAELQVSFNEAINSVTKEKDAIIDGLKEKLAALEAMKGERLPSDGEMISSQSDSGASTGQEVPGPLPEDTELLTKGKLPSLSKMGPCIDCTYKISILTCDVGDLILLCYEDKYDSFVAFHLGQFIHFLHSDCLQPLGLKIPAGPTERWALGVVTNKEFCVARKPTNRFKMNVGTKFYRLKVKPWDREKAKDDFHVHRNSQSTSASARTLSVEEAGGGAKSMSASSI